MKRSIDDVSENTLAKDNTVRFLKRETMFGMAPKQEQEIPVMRIIAIMSTRRILDMVAENRTRETCHVEEGGDKWDRQE